MNISILLFIAIAFLMGTAAYRLWGEKSLVFLVPLVFWVSGDVYHHVNPILFFVALLFLHLFSFLETDTILHKAVLPGIICGVLLNGSFYLFPVLLAPILAVFFYSANRRFLKIVLFMAVIPLGYIVSIPLSLTLFFPVKIIESAYPSYPYLVLGVGTLAAAAVGVFFSFRKDWKRTLVLLSVPIAAGVYAFSVEPSLLYFAYSSLFLFAAFGLLEIFRLLRDLLEKISFFGKRELIKTYLPLAIMIGVIFLLFPAHRAFKKWEKPPDTRTTAAAWIEKNVKPGTVLVIPSEMGMDTTELEKNYAIYTPYFDTMAPNWFYHLDRILERPCFVYPWFDAERDHHLDFYQSGQLRELRKNIREEFSLQGLSVNLDYYYPLPKGNPELSIGWLKGRYSRRLPVTGYSVWDTREGIAPEKISPSQTVFSQRGEFNMEFVSRQGHNEMIIQSLSPDEEGRRVLQLGYMPGRKGFEMDLPEGGTVHMVVDAEMKNYSPGTACILMVRDRLASGEWDTVQTPLSLEGRRINILSKKVRAGCVRLLFSVRFQPASKKELLIIRHFKIFVSV